MQIMQWPLSKITPYVRNARKIPPQAIDKVAASIQEFGWRQPIVVDAQGVIICGHARLLAAQKLGYEQAPVHVADNLTPGHRSALRDRVQSRVAGTSGLGQAAAGWSGSE